MAKNNKLIAGITLAIIHKLISRESAAYYEENRNELYAILDRANFRFHNEKQLWVERTFEKRRAPRVKVIAEPKPDNTESADSDFLALVRVIAPQSRMDYIIAQMNELFPCLNAEMLSVSKRYPGYGTWERVYLRVRFSQFED